MEKCVQMSFYSVRYIYEQNSSTLTEPKCHIDKTGIVTTSQKLTIASFGGFYEPSLYEDTPTPLDFTSSAFNSYNLASFLSSSSIPSSSSEPASLASVKSGSSISQIDILLTNQWPASIVRQSKTVPADLQSQATSSHLVPPLDEISKACKPRYHFASCGGEPLNPVFWEREPYVTDEKLLSRFVSIGSLAASLNPSSKKQRVSKGASPQVMFALTEDSFSGSTHSRLPHLPHRHRQQRDQPMSPTPHSSSETQGEAPKEPTKGMWRMEGTSSLAMSKRKNLG